MTRYLQAIVFVFFSTLSLYGQTIAGKVVDLTNNEALIGAVVISQSDTAITDESGRFQLNTTLPLEVQIRYIGYELTEVTLSKTGSVIGLKASSTELGSVIVSAGASSQTIYTSPTSISVIDTKLLQRDAPFTTTAALNRTPGVLMQSGTLNTNRLTIRGIGSRSLYGTNKVKAYYDEIPLTDGSGNSTIEDIDQNFIDRMEIIKGPNSSIYGAGLGGVVRLFSHRAEPMQTSLDVSQTVGSFGMSRFSIRADHNDGKNQITLGVTDLLSEGFRDNSNYNRKQAGMTARTEINEKTSISTIAQYTWLKAYIPSSINEQDYLNSPEKAAFTWGQAQGYEQYNKGLVGLTLNQRFNQSSDLKVSVFGKYRDAYEPRPFNILAENTQTIGTRAIYSKEWKTFKIHLGTELFRDNYQWSTFENNYTADTNGSVEGALLTENKEIRTYQNVFWESSYSLTKAITVSGGLNFNHTAYDLSNEYDINGNYTSGSYSFDPVLSPKLGINYQHELFSLFGNISHGFSPPSLEETLYPDGQINPNIQPESGWNYELGTRGQKGGFKYDLVGYYMEIKNLLVAQRTAEDAYVGVNAGVNNHFGVDLLMNYSIDINSNYQLNAFFSSSWMHYEFGEFTNDDIRYDGNQLTGVPQWIINGGFELLSAKGFYGNINANYTGEMPMDDANSLYSSDYFLLRSRIGYLIPIKRLDIDLYLGADNLTSTHYASMILINATGFGGAAPRYYYPGNPRSLYSGIKLKYKF
ncbi:MAG: TonB-dependent receptor [Flammeovirgaceae bacterium]|nr:TonB-dependent receptor [Flammeovirgaceae bacterium]MBE60789.1 TonB-dependent receptor [Flammeovirgaceae bacterium]